jgi:arginyl-tRNA synthetase
MQALPLASSSPAPADAIHNAAVVVEDPALRSARLALADASRIVLARALGLLGVSAPQRM